LFKSWVASTTNWPCLRRELAYIEKSIDYNNAQVAVTREEIAVIEARLSGPEGSL
jgi:hypothetical protein